MTSGDAPSRGSGGGPAVPFCGLASHPARARRVASGLLLVLAAWAAALLHGPRASAEGPAPEAAAGHRRIRVVEFEGEIGAVLKAYVERHLETARQAGDDLLILRIDSPGGTVLHSEQLADLVLGLPRGLRTLAWVEQRCFSGAAMVALACDEIVMGPRAALGDCQPILLGAEGLVPVGEKIETVLRAQFRKYAEDNGWPVLLAEKMVSQDMEVVQVRDERDGRLLLADGAELASARDDDLVAGVPKRHLTRLAVVAPKGRLLTLTTPEARQHGFVRRTFATEAELLEAVAAPGARVEVAEMTFSERASRTLLDYAGVLTAVVLLCVTLTLFQGVGTASLIGLVALLLLGLVTLTADLAQGFPLLLLLVGLLLLLAEVLLIPGFGVPGVLGIVLLAGGFLALVSGVTFSSPGTLTWASAKEFLAQFVLTGLLGAGLLLLLVRFGSHLPLVGRHAVLEGGAGGAGAALPAGLALPALGASGTARTALRPAGQASLAGRVVDVVSEGGYVEAGLVVRVVRVEGARVVVRPDAPEPRS